MKGIKSPCSAMQPDIAMVGTHQGDGRVETASARRPRELYEPDISDPHRFLDHVMKALLSGADTAVVMHNLSDGLLLIRRALGAEKWRIFVAESLEHDLINLIHQDPFTRRSYHKPSGYAGDARLLDYIYFDLGKVDISQETDLGRRIFARNKNAPAPIAVRERRDFAATLIDEVCNRVPGAKILAAACGHFREAEKSEAVRSGEFGQILALDQDAESLQEVDRSYGPYGVQTRCLEIRRILGKAFEDESFDLIYAAGLYDYLDDRFAKRLTQRLFEMLRPGGRVVIGNFVPDIYDAGYMESYMGWSLIYRDLAQLYSLASEITDSQVSIKLVYTLLSPDIGYLEVRKRAGRRAFGI